MAASSFKERLHKGYAQVMELSGKPLADEKSRYQRIKIFDTPNNGRVMTLDDIVQITTRDESAYAEMLTHLPLLEHGKAERVMIVGGGDLSIADEALKHKGVKEVVLVDIDGRVIELCKKHFGEINAKAFKDKRLKLEVAGLDDEKLAETRGVSGTTPDWVVLEARVRVPSDATLVQVRIRREKAVEPEGNLGGKVWLDDVSLVPLAPVAAAAGSVAGGRS